MKKQYCVFWLPTIFHKELQNKKTEITNQEDSEGFFDLSDGSSYPYYAKFTLTNKEDIIISSKVTTLQGVREFDTKLTLEYKQKRKNGFVQFSFDEDTVPVDCRNPFRLNLTNTIYHKIKEFYHEHECHTGKDCDLILTIGSKPFNLESDDNPVLIGFLGDFSKLFHKNVVSISGLNKWIKALFIDYLKIKQKIGELSESDIRRFKELHNDILRIQNLINQLCENSSIEYTYCKTLLSSIHNTSFHHNVELDTQTKDFEVKNGYRRQALNIRNAVRFVENIKYKNQNRHNYLLHISDEDIKRMTAEIQNQNEKIDKTNVNILQAQGDIAHITTKVEEQNNEISKMLVNGERTQNISIILGFVGVLYALVSVFNEKIKDSRWLGYSHWWTFTILIIGVISGIVLFRNTKLYRKFWGKD